jgi:hypothetical protein
MITFYLDLMGPGVWTVTGYGDEGQVSEETFFDLYSARMHLTELEEDGNVCIDTTMVGY